METTKIGKAEPRFYNKYHAADIRELAEPGSQLAMEAQRYLDEAAEGFSFKELSEKCPWRYTNTRCMAHDHSGGDYRDDDPEFNMCDEEACAVYHFLAKLQLLTSSSTIEHKSDGYKGETCIPNRIVNSPTVFFCYTWVWEEE